jgi:3-methylfumaryl-CoA hydratase
MWAGSRVSYPGALTVGQEASRTSVISKVQAKSGRGGQLVFVTVTHTTSCGGSDCIVEEQDIVYREPGDPNAPAAPLTPAHDQHELSQPITPDTTLLFRYSALTYNGHRIHYDQAYARNEEHYPDLVVHGPLTATLLQNFAVANAAGQRLTQFDFRGLHPLFVSAPFTLQCARERDACLKVWARGPSGELAMQATATLSAN